MIDQAKASRAAKEGFELWQAGELQGAAGFYLEALECADPNHYALADYHGEFGEVLSALGRQDEAREQYQLALAVEMRNDPLGGSPSVLAARYFLGKHYLEMSFPELALEAVKPGLFANTKFTGPLEAVQAEALWRLGRVDEARESALRALAGAGSDKQREGINKEMQHILFA
jgi:tetratricopeptide (TPR) repeat protein